MCREEENHTLVWNRVGARTPVLAGLGGATVDTCTRTRHYKCLLPHRRRVRVPLAVLPTSINGQGGSPPPPAPLRRTHQGSGVW